jgi:hypothetical protein
MTTAVLNLRLSENALTMLDRLRAPTGASRDRWAHGAMIEAASGAVGKWNLLEAHGSVILDDQGQLVVEPKDVPPMEIVAGSPNAQFHLSFPAVVLDHLAHAAQLSAAARIHHGLRNPWPTVNAWAEHYLTDAIALAQTQVDAARAKAELDREEKATRLEAERARRRAQAESEGSEPAPSPSGTVAALVDPSGGASEEGSAESEPPDGDSPSP